MEAGFRFSGLVSAFTVLFSVFLVFTGDKDDLVGDFAFSDGFFTGDCRVAATSVLIGVGSIFNCGVYAKDALGVPDIFFSRLAFNSLSEADFLLGLATVYRPSGEAFGSSLTCLVAFAGISFLLCFD